MVNNKVLSRHDIRKKAVRAKIQDSGRTIRLGVYRSSAHIYGFVVDEAKGKTLFGASDLELAKTKSEKATKSQKAFEVGKLLAQKAIKVGIKKVAFDRSGFLYHGRVRNLADGAREGGLEF